MDYLYKLGFTSFLLGLAFLVVTKETLKNGNLLSALILVCTSSIVLIIGIIAAKKALNKMKD